MATIYINLAVEDALSEAVLQKILKSSGKEYIVKKCFEKGRNRRCAIYCKQPKTNKKH